MKIKIEEKTKQNILTLTISGLIILAVFFLIRNFSFIYDFFGKLLSILLPFTVGFGIAFIFSPLMKVIEEKLFKSWKATQKTKRFVAALITLLVAIALVVLLIILILPQVIYSISSLSSQFSDIMVTGPQALEDFLLGFGFDKTTIDNLLGTSDGIFATVFDFVKQYLPQVLNTSIEVIKILGNSLVGLIIALYILIDKERFALQVKKITYAIFPKKQADWLVELSRDSAVVFNKFIIGKTIDSTIIGILCYIGLFILNEFNVIDGQYTLLISVIVGVTNMIPVFGPFIGAVPGIFILILINPIQVVWFCLFILVLQQFDGNILGPKILGDSVGLPSLWIMFAIIVGGGFFGVLGMFLGVPVFAMIYTIVKKATEKRLNEKEITVE